MKQIAYLKDRARGVEIRAAYIRAIPNGKVISSIERHEWVTLTGNAKDTATASWTEVRKNDGTVGWVASRLIEVHDNPDPPPPEPCFPPRDIEIPLPGKLRKFDVFIALLPIALVLFAAAYVLGWIR